MPSSRLVGMTLSMIVTDILLLREQRRDAGSHRQSLLLDPSSLLKDTLDPILGCSSASIFAALS